MAPKRRVGTERNPNNPNQALIIVLIFFILLSIGLGIGTYTGYSSIDEETKKKVTAEKPKVQADNSRDVYKYKALLFLAYIGHLKAEDWEELNTLKHKFDTSTHD